VKKVNLNFGSLKLNDSKKRQRQQNTIGQNFQQTSGNQEVQMSFESMSESQQMEESEGSVAQYGINQN
jgi:hypothetical protein